MKNKINLLLTLFLVCLGLGVTQQAWGYSWTSGKTLYFDNTVTGTFPGISNPKVRLGDGNYSESHSMTKVAGTANCYKYTHSSDFNNAAAFVVSNNSGWTGSNNTIYQPYKDGETIKPNDSYAITRQLAFYEHNVSEDKYFIPTDHKNKENNCDYYNYDVRTSGWTITITTPHGGVLKVEKYNNDEGTDLTKITDGAVVLPTQYIKVTIVSQPANGYTITKIKVGDDEISDGGHYSVRGDKTIQPKYEEIPYEVTLTGFTTAKATAYISTTGSATLSVPAGKEYSTYNQTNVTNVTVNGTAVTFNATANGTLEAVYTYLTPAIDVASSATYTLGGAAIKLNPKYSNLAADATYAWTCTAASGTGASTDKVTFSDATVANPNISASVEGTYTITLTATNGTGAGSKTSEVKTITLTASEFKGADCGTCFDYLQQ